MLILRPAQLERPHPCGYFADRAARFKNFIALRLDARELETVLASGWRKFGPYYFKPCCPGCRDCIPIRILTQEFVPSKSQRKLLRKNSDTVAHFLPLTCSENIFEIYQEHSLARFNRVVSWEEFVHNFYTPSCLAFQSEYYVSDKLAAVGFLDQSSRGLSSVYFFYQTQYSQLGLGNLSILKEIEYAAALGLPYYYLGYYIAQNHSMAYKHQFYPHERYDWAGQKWHRFESREAEQQEEDES